MILTVTLDQLLTATLPADRAAVVAVRRAVLRAVRESHGQALPAVVRAVRAALRRAVPLLADSFRDSTLAAIAAAAHATAMPALDGGEPAEAARLPTTRTRNEYIDRGFDWLESQRLVTSAHAATLDAAARRQAEVIAHAATEQVARTLGARLAEAVRTGATVRQFHRAANDALDDSPLAPYQTEALYRTNAGRAFAAGQQLALAHPQVAAGFPYVLYSAAHDSRTRPDHLAMERLGLDGTAVYRAEDPVIRKFYPPWAWNCRCAAIPLGVADAARHGAEEAKRWAATGTPPERPEYVAPPPFDLPRGWVPVSAGVVPTPVV